MYALTLPAGVTARSLDLAISDLGLPDFDGVVICGTQVQVCCATLSADQLEALRVVVANSSGILPSPSGDTADDRILAALNRIEQAVGISLSTSL